MTGSWSAVLHSIAHILTLVAVTVHAVFGCCWHHVHACECGEEVTNEAVSVLAGSGTGCDHDHDHAHKPDPLAVHGCHRHSHPCGAADEDAEGSPAEHEHHEHEPCDETTCSYSLTSSPKLKFSVPLIARLNGSQQELFCRPAALAVRTCRLERVAGQSRGAPGLCAQLQVWLL